MTRYVNERGMALAVAIFALVVIGALVGGAFFVGMQEQKVGRNTLKLSQALGAAEAGAYTQIANWNATSYNQMPIGGKSTFGPAWLAGNNGWYRGNVRRLNSLLFLVESEGFSRDSSARQRVGVVTRLRLLELGIRGGLETQGEVSLVGNAKVSGIDQVPPGFVGCPVPVDTLPGIIAQDTSEVSTSGNGDIDGKPEKLQDPSLNDSTLTTFGDLSFDDLRQFATKVLPGGNYANSIQPSQSGGVCSTGSSTNWGEPGTSVVPCRSYFPLVFLTGDATINGRRGQGILVVDGDLEVQGGFDFVGPVIVRGRLKLSGSPGSPSRFYGGVIAANVEADEIALSGNGTINYSRCAIDRALAGSAPAWPLKERAWASLY